jgi:glycosyltransferase involved in cell wall biosynthesis
MKEQIQTLGLSEVVQWIGFRKDIPAVMQTIDLFILPSQQPDPFPTVILEAMASAKPVIATHFGGAVEMIESGVTGDLIPPDRADIAADVINSWLDVNKLQQAGQAARKRVLEKFSWEAWEDKMIKFIT